MEFSGLLNGRFLALLLFTLAAIPRTGSVPEERGKKVPEPKVATTRLRSGTLHDTQKKNTGLPRLCCFSTAGQYRENSMRATTSNYNH